MHLRSGVAKLRKAARGKHRWVGLTVDESVTNREELEKLLSQSDVLSGGCKLFDFIDGKAIIRIPLESYEEAKSILKDGFNGLISQTSSGKIRLVRDRMGIKVSRKKR
ncbi:MAG: hypothetical protein CXX81_18615 [Methanobacteriota archaeon]|nr:MAG: hypothetical protein CXX81_18615 [Euryarchaeota archaeon]HIB23400.1 hypothetical protein [Candidatus Poseidoniales archaeon]HIO86621.1 hypothetical protein [Candidatus Poseidoniales archaeon]